MSGDQTPSTSSSTTEGLPLSQNSNSDISPESLIFQSSSMTSALSSAGPILPQDLMTIQGLDSSDAAASFTVGDIVASSGSAILSADPVISADNEGLGVTEYQLVDGGNGELIVVTSTLPQKGSILSDVTASMAEQGQTITLNLEEASQLLLQQQGLSGTVQLTNGNMQILGNSLVDKESLPLEVLQALQGELGSSLPNIESTYCLAETETGSMVPDKPETIKEEADEDKEKEKHLVSVSIQNSSLVDAGKEVDAVFSIEQGKKDNVYNMTENGNDSTVGKVEAGEGQEEESTETKNPDESTAHPVNEEKVPDMNSPIPVTDQTVVMINGKKCILAFNEETQQMCAYPIKRPTGKKRGRPKMTAEEKLALAEKRRQEKEQPPVAEAPLEQSSAAETLLELSSVGSNGVRRSARKRKKAKLLEEYEELEDSDEEEPFVDNQDKDPDIMMNLPDLKKKKLLGKDEAIKSPQPVFGTPTAVAKRGRGRPRRYPPAGQSQTPTSIPAVIIPSANGQTLVMTELQGFQNLRNFQRQLPNLVPKPVVEASNTSQTTPEGSAEINPLTLGGEADPLHLDTAEALDNQSIIPTALQGDTVPLVGGDSDNMEGTENTTTGIETTGPEKSKEDQPPISQDSTDQLNQPTVIQIPENLLPMLGIKKDPIKIGLKASERELEKLKCPKCDFQGFYAHQYRAHIATHGDDIHKCKCCSYVSLDSEELLAHFKEFHPRCICPDCDFMAEHAYIIKRHMMRHNAKSCTCHICGKVYKDMYILKMHVKMVHMPAEVLFECNVCSKKFTRKAHLKRHLRIHDPEKPFKCPHCEYRGCERSDISKHMLIHEEPKHVCERCGKTFRHIKNKELHVKRHYGQRDYKCGVCDFFGYTFTDIRKHIERKHQDIKTLICDKCNKHFRSEMALKEHQQVCNVMMIEQILAIPTSAGGTSQATIQIPAIVGPDGQRLLLDGQSTLTATTEGGQSAIPLGSHTVCVQDGNGKPLAVGVEDKHAGTGAVDIMVTEHSLGLSSGEVGDEEGLLELTDDETGMHQTMQIIGETIMTESGQQLRIISHESLGEAAGHVMDITGQTIVGHTTEDGGDVLPSEVVAAEACVGDGGMVGQSSAEVVGIAGHHVAEFDSDCDLKLKQEADVVKEQSQQGVMVTGEGEGEHPVEGGVAMGDVKVETDDTAAS